MKELLGSPFWFGLVLAIQQKSAFWEAAVEHEAMWPTDMYWKSMRALVDKLEVGSVNKPSMSKIKRVQKLKQLDQSSNG